jgi:hypothetical protein
LVFSCLSKPSVVFASAGGAWRSRGNILLDGHGASHLAMTAFYSEIFFILNKIYTQKKSFCQDFLIPLADEEFWVGERAERRAAY